MLKLTVSAAVLKFVYIFAFEANSNKHMPVEYVYLIKCQQRSRARFPALPVFLSSDESGAESTQLLERKVTAPGYKTEVNDRGDPPR
jgi:hypothetical protein